MRVVKYLNVCEVPWYMPYVRHSLGEGNEILRYSSGKAAIKMLAWVWVSPEQLTPERSAFKLAQAVGKIYFFSVGMRDFILLMAAS